MNKLSQQCPYCDSERISLTRMELLTIDGDDHILEMEKCYCTMCKKYLPDPVQSKKIGELIQEIRDAKKARL